MPNTIPEGYFRDAEGELQRDRRKPTNERRSARNSAFDGDRRNRLRRKTDVALRKREADQQIEDALESFAEEHDH